MKKYINHTGPFRKVRVGRFEISLWQWTKLITAPQQQRDYKPDREYIVRRAKIRFSRYNKRDGLWEEEAVWCNISDLEELRQALDKLSEEERGEGGADAVPAPTTT